MCHRSHELITKHNLNIQAKGVFPHLRSLSGVPTPFFRYYLLYISFHTAKHSFHIPLLLGYPRRRKKDMHVLVPVWLLYLAPLASPRSNASPLRYVASLRLRGYPWEPKEAAPCFALGTQRLGYPRLGYPHRRLVCFATLPVRCLQR